MSRLHSTLVAFILGGAAAAGLFAAVHTVRLGQNVSAAKAAPVAARKIAARQAKLDRWSRSLQKARAKRPPALPRLPKFKPVQSPPAAPAAAPPPAAAVAAAPQVKYVRPTVVRYRHASSSPKTSTTTSRSSWSDDGGTSDDGSTHGGD
jgi:hypothetical protein